MSLLNKLIRRVKPKRQTASGQTKLRKLLGAKNAIEIGGPSKIFSAEGILPIYDVVATLDNVNYSNETVWKEHSNSDSMLRAIHESVKIDNQFIFEADDLSRITTSTYDVVLSSHVLEHIANPVKALEEWCRVLKPHGTLVLIIPNKDGSFDHNRPVTTMTHLLHDYKNNVGPEDLTHLPEVLQMHDMEMDEDAGTIEEFTSRSKDNLINRCMHHHVFDQELAENVVKFGGFQLLHSEVRWNCHIIIIAKKLID